VIILYISAATLVLISLRINHRFVVLGIQIPGRYTVETVSPGFLIHPLDPVSSTGTIDHFQPLHFSISEVTGDKFPVAKLAKHGRYFDLQALWDRDSEYFFRDDPRENECPSVCCPVWR